MGWLMARDFHPGPSKKQHWPASTYGIWQGWSATVNLGIPISLNVNLSTLAGLILGADGVIDPDAADLASQSRKAAQRANLKGFHETRRLGWLPVGP